MSEAAPEPPEPMDADSFIAWSMRQPEGERYELVDGRVVRMASERAAHARTKFRVARLMAEAIDAQKLGCEVFGDGMAVVVDEHTIYEPDASLRCGPRLADDVVKMLDPLVVVEVVSPSSHALDSGGKLADYFRIASVRHYLIIRTGRRVIIQHSRGEDGRITTSIIADGVVALDPPGITLSGVFE